MFNNPNILYYFSLLLPCAICLFGAACLIFKRQDKTRSQDSCSGIFDFCTLFSLHSELRCWTKRSLNIYVVGHS